MYVEVLKNNKSYDVHQSEKKRSNCEGQNNGLASKPSSGHWLVDDGIDRWLI